MRIQPTYPPYYLYVQYLFFPFFPSQIRAVKLCKPTCQIEELVSEDCAILQKLREKELPLTPVCYNYTMARLSQTEKNARRLASRRGNRVEINRQRRIQRRDNLHTANAQQRAYRAIEGRAEASNERRRNRRRLNREQANQNQRDYREVIQDDRAATRVQRRVPTRAQRHGELQTTLDDRNFIVSEDELYTLTHGMYEDANGGRTREQGVFADANTSLLKSVMLFYVNSGCTRFDEWKNYTSKYNDKPIDVEKMKKEIAQEQLSEEELINKINLFAKEHSYTPKELLSCSACGIRCYDEKYTQWLLSSSTGDKFKYATPDKELFRNKLQDAEEVEIYVSATETKRVNPWKAKSFYISQSQEYYHFHPELVSLDNDNNEIITLCGDCNRERDSLPPNSIAAGVDFGSFHRLGLVPLNLQEETVLSFVRLFITIFKISSNRTGRVNVNVNYMQKIHAILFGHDCPHMVAERLGEVIDLINADSLMETMLVLFYDSHGRYDTLVKRMHGSSFLFPRWWQIISWIRVWKVIHPKYLRVRMPEKNNLQAVLEKAQETVIHESRIITDKNIIAQDEAIGSDVAQTTQIEVPPGSEVQIAQHDTPTGEEPEDTENPPLQVTYVCDDPSTFTTKDPTRFAAQCLHSIEKLADIDKDEDSHPHETSPSVMPHDEITAFDFAQLMNLVHQKEVSTTRKGEPINEIGNKKLLGIAFPSTFMFGTTYPNKGPTLGNPQILHLEQQFTNIPQKDMRLRGYLEDVVTRFEVMHGVVSHIKSNPRAVDKISKLCVDKKLQEEIKIAKQAIHTRYATRTLKKYTPHLCFSAMNIPHSPFEGTKLKSQCMESCRRYGPPTGFATLAFDAKNNPRSFRASFRSVNNDTFPAIFERDCPYGNSPEDFIAELIRHSVSVASNDIYSVQLDANARATAAMENPSANVMETKTLLFNVLSILFGIPPEHFFQRQAGSSRRTTQPFVLNKGILGHCLAIIGVTEEHAKGTLHFHLLIYGGILPYAMQEFASIPELCGAIVKVLDSQYKTKLPPLSLLVQLIKQEFRFKINTSGSQPFLPSTLSNCNPGNIIAQAQESLESINDFICKKVCEQANMKWHEHMRTCEKGKLGASGCRLAYPRGIVNGTRPIQLLPNPEFNSNPDPDSTEMSNRDIYLVEAIQVNNSPIYKTTDATDGTLPDNVIVWETNRPLANNILELPEGTDPSRHNVLQHLHSLLDTHPDFKTWTGFWTWLNNQADSNLFLWMDDLTERLQLANGFVPSFNPIISFLTGSHNNVELLGSTDQAVGAVFYICPYMNKDKEALAECLSVLQDTTKHVLKYPSKFPDHGQPSRTAKHVLERAINQIHLKTEHSTYQGAAKLLQLPSLITTEKYSYLKPSAEIATSLILQNEREVGGGTDLILSQEEYRSYQATLELETPDPNTTMQSAQDQAGLETLNDATLANNSAQNSINGDHTLEAGNCNEQEEQDQNSSCNDSVQDHSDSENQFIDDGESSDYQSDEEENPLEQRDYLMDLENVRRIALLKNIGSFKLYTIEQVAEDGTEVGSTLKKFVPYSLLYNNRGKGLRHLSRYEMSALVQLVEKPKNDVNSRLAFFDMAPSFILAARYGYRMLQKQNTPQLTSKMPPHPGPFPGENSPRKQQWEIRADAFARYILIVYRPEESFYDSRLQTNAYSYTYKALQEWKEGLQNDTNEETTNVISAFRLMMVRRCIRNVRAKSSVKKRLCQYRGRDRKTWNKTRYLSGAAYEALNDTTKFPFQFNPILLTGHQLHSRIANAQLLHAEVRTYQSISTPPVNSNPTLMVNPCGLITESQPLDVTGTFIKARLQEIKHDVPKENASLEKASWQASTVYAATYQIQTPDFTMNCEQQQIVDIVMNTLDPTICEDISLPNVSLITGSSGTGKSELIKHISKKTKEIEIDVFKTSFNCINALHVDGRITASCICTNKALCGSRLPLLGMNDIKRFKEVTGIGDPEKNVKLVIFDEISLEAPFHIANFSATCQYVLDNHEQHFGGLHVLLIGDLSQMQPVKAGLSLTQAVSEVLLNDPNFELLISSLRNAGRSGGLPPYHKKPRTQSSPPGCEKFCPDHPFSIGAKIMMDAKWFQMTQQIRASTDSAQRNLVSRFTSGEPIRPSDRAHIQELSQADLEKEEWLLAPMIVATNAERLLITYHRALSYARFRKFPVVRWLMKLNSTSSHEEQVNNPEETPDPCAFEYFVQSALGYITEKINDSLGLVNAQSIVYHSLVPRSQSDWEKILASCNTHVVDIPVVTLDEEPQAIIVLIKNKVLATLSQEIQARLYRLSLSSSEILIPIAPTSNNKYRNIISLDEPINAYRDLLAAPHFPLVMNFAMTVNKSEGQTLPRVIIAMSKRPNFNFTYAGLNVGCTRVRHSADMRSFVCGESDGAKQITVAYIEKLKSDPSIEAYFAGFGSFNPQTWTTREFDKHKAARKLGDQFYRQKR